MMCVSRPGKLLYDGGMHSYGWRSLTCTSTGWSKEGNASCVSTSLMQPREPPPRPSPEDQDVWQCCDRRARAAGPQYAHTDEAHTPHPDTATRQHGPIYHLVPGSPAPYRLAVYSGSGVHTMRGHYNCAVDGPRISGSTTALVSLNGRSFLSCSSHVAAECKTLQPGHLQSVGSCAPAWAALRQCTPSTYCVVIYIAHLYDGCAGVT